MKKTLLLIAMFLMPAWAGAMTTVPEGMGIIPKADLPPALSSYSKTTTLEWGCPVADEIEASTQDEAIQQVRRECIEEVSKAAALKPDVMNVINTRVVWPDIVVEEVSGAFHMKGTLFLETLVLQRSQPGDN